MAKQVRTHYGFDRPDVEVVVGDTYWPSVLRMWTQDDDDSQHGNVEYQASDGTRSATFPAASIRTDPVDRSRGRDTS